MRTALLAVSIFALVSCGGSDSGGDGGTGGGGGAGGGGGGTGGSGGAGGGGGGMADGPTSGPGTVTVKVEALAGVKDKILLGFLYPTGMGPMAAVAGLCVPVTASPFSKSEAMKTRKMGSMDPCDLETTAKIVDAGSFELSLAIYTGGSMTPERCGKAAVTVAGDTTVTAPTLGMCP